METSPDCTDFDVPAVEFENFEPVLEIDKLQLLQDDDYDTLLEEAILTGDGVEVVEADPHALREVNRRLRHEGGQ